MNVERIGDRDCRVVYTTRETSSLRREQGTDQINIFNGVDLSGFLLTCKERGLSRFHFIRSSDPDADLHCSIGVGKISDLVSDGTFLSVEEQTGGQDDPIIWFRPHFSELTYVAQIKEPPPSDDPLVGFRDEQVVVVSILYARQARRLLKAAGLGEAQLSFSHVGRRKK